jgi:exodeoxyribonuclease V gamma subunit
VSVTLHRAERTDLLADDLAGLLALPLDDPFAEEVVVVPARGVERWLTQRLSHRLGVGPRGGDGVCAGVRFLNPHSLVAMLLGKERDDVWDPDRMVWPLLQVIDAAMGEPWCATLSAHLGFGDAGEEGLLRRSRRYSVARRLAGLFAAYAVQRPALITDWGQGRDTDGAGNPLDEDLRWQPELWRRLVATVGEPPPDERHRATVERLRGGGGAGLELPSRLSLFGHTRLPVTEVQLLAALGELREVHLWLPQPSVALWDAIAALPSAGPVPRPEDRSAELVRHPLLATLGRDARELQRTLLGELGQPPGKPAGGATPTAGASDSASPATPESVLGWLQHDIRANVEPEPATRAARSARLGEGLDRSVQVHACHGASRQIDVLREVLVGLLEDDPTLEPRDILVMCPDIETYAPVIQAGFGLADVSPEHGGHPAHRLRVRLADRALTSTNPLLAVAGTLVELAGSRITATEVLDLAAAPAVRRRFGFDDDDLDQLASWVDRAGIRWGLDRDHRRGYGLTLPDNTWRTGLDRVLLGAAMAEDGDRVPAVALPVDDVPSGDIDLAGRFAELLDRLEGFIHEAQAATTIAQWTGALSVAVTRLAAVDPREAWQTAQFDRELARMHDAAAAQAGEPTGGTRLLLADVRHLLAHRLGGRPTRANFRTGTLTVCTMVPMRSVPHRVVCLVGLDDGVFPRTQAVDGDDALARTPLTGERDVRSEDRQLLLDAVNAATETLVITYTGANEHTGAERPPAVPLGELLDAVDITTATALRETVLVRHPLQPFDERNLIAGELVPGAPRAFSFDSAALAGAEAARGERLPTGRFLPGPLPAPAREDVELTALQAFFSHPVRGFLRARLDVTAPLEAEEILDAIPIELDGLAKWQVGDRLLSGVLAGLEPQSSLAAERLRGLLPPGALGGRTLTEVIDKVRPLHQAALQLRQGEPRTLDVDVDLGDGRRLTGTVGPVFGNRLVTVNYSRLAPRHRLRAWIDLLALSAGHPDQNWTGHAVGNAPRGAGVSCAQTGPLDHRARDWLRELVDLYDRGLCEPLPLPVKTACAYAEAAHRALRGEGVDPDQMAAREWITDPFNKFGITGEDGDVAHVRVFGEHPGMGCLTTAPRPDEDWNDAPHRLGRYALRLWTPLLDGAERVGVL